MFIADIPNIPQVTETQFERHAFLNDYRYFAINAAETNNERVWIQFLIQANTFKILAEWDVEDFVKANYLVQALKNFDAFTFYSK